MEANLCGRIDTGVRSRFPGVTAMTTTRPEDVPFMQRLYNRIWLLALIALAFFALSYVVWGLIDIYSVPAG